MNALDLPAYQAFRGEVFRGGVWLPRETAEGLLKLYREDPSAFARNRAAELADAMSEAYHIEDAA